MGLRPITLSCIALFLLVHYSYLCLYKGSLVLIYSVNTIHRLSVFNILHKEAMHTSQKTNTDNSLLQRISRLLLNYLKCDFNIAEIQRFRYGIVSLRVSTIVICMYFLIKYVSVVVKYV
jgi:hypothetical protein